MLRESLTLILILVGTVNFTARFLQFLSENRTSLGVTAACLGALQNLIFDLVIVQDLRDLADAEGGPELLGFGDVGLLSAVVVLLRLQPDPRVGDLGGDGLLGLGAFFDCVLGRFAVGLIARVAERSGEGGLLQRGRLFQHLGVLEAPIQLLHDASQGRVRPFVLAVLQQFRLGLSLLVADFVLPFVSRGDASRHQSR